MLSQHIALVPEAGGVNASELARVCAALQKQLTRDFAPVWGITATIDAFPHLEDVPLGYWPIIITFCDLGDQAGVHIDRNGQPYAQVEMSPGWSLHASQACIDMLVNPYGRRLVAGPSPRPDQGPVEFLLEIGAPCLSGDCAYVIDEVLVSDFCTPAFWGAMVAAGGGFSFTGALQGPHHVMPGGHLTWHDPISDKWWLRHHLDHTLVDTKLGALDGRTGVVREAMRLRAPQAMRAEKMSVETFEARLGVRRQHSLQASQFQAHRLRTMVASEGSQNGRELEAGNVIERSVKSINGDGPATARLFAKGSSQGRLPRYLEEDVEVEVNQTELLAEDERILASFKETEPAAAVPRKAPAREAPTSQAPVRSTPPPLPDVPRAPEPQSAVQPATLPQFDAVPAPTQQASTPQAPLRATPLPPPRMPERTYSSSSISPPSTVPPVSMGQVASRPAVNTWILAATLAATVAISFLGFALYTRATSLPDESGARAASNASPITPTQVAATNAVTAPTQPAAPAPTAPIIAAPTAVATTPPATTPPATAPPATTPVATAPPAATATMAPAVIATTPPAPPQPKLVRAKAAAPPAAPRRAAAPPADDSDPLEGLIGERR